MSLFGNLSLPLFLINNKTMYYTKFKVVLMDEARSFLKSLPQDAQQKITYNFNKVAAGFSNVELFKKLESSDIWEFRTLYKGIAYRLFAFWDNEAETLVVATHGIIKKTDKTPAKEIAKAENTRKIYFENKKG